MKATSRSRRHRCRRPAAGARVLSRRPRPRDRAPEELPSQAVRAHFIRLAGPRSNCSRRRADGRRSPGISRKRGPGPAPHHAASRRHRGARSRELKARGVRLIDRDAAARRARLAGRLHPSRERARRAGRAEAGRGAPRDAYRRASGTGTRSTAMQFGALRAPPARRRRVPPRRRRDVRRRAEAAVGAARAGRRAQPDPLAMRPLLVRGERTLLIDAGVGGQDGREERRDLRPSIGRRTLRESLGGAGVRCRGHRHRARVAPAFRSRRRLHPARCRRHAGAGVPAARATSRATAEWEDATHPHERNRASYFAENYVPLHEAGVLDLDARRRRGHAGRPRAAHRRPHHAPSDRLPRVGRADGRLRRRSDPDDGACRHAVDDGLRPLSDGHAGVQADVHRARRSSANI